jgi:hypothetical protein
MTTADRLRAACEASGTPISGDGRIAADACARLIGWSAGHLANARSEGRGPPYFRIGMGSSKISFRIDELADWIDGRAGE